MSTFILLGILTFICAAIGIIIEFTDKYDDFFVLKATFISLAVCCFIGIVCAGLSLINIDTRFEAIQNDYKSVVQMVDSYDGSDYGNMTALTERVVEMNHTITQHRAHYKSRWTGPWYSEDIAKLELIDFSKKVQKVE